MKPGDHTADLDAIAKASGQSPLLVLELFLERAAIREYEGGYPRAEAERLAIGDTADSLGLDRNLASQHGPPHPGGCMTRRGNGIARAGGPQEQADCAPVSGDTGPENVRQRASQALLEGAGASDRDSWCTPSWLTDLLPPVDLDPCSNARSTVAALKAYRLDRGEDGLALPWAGSLFVNPPYSDVRPWAEKLLGSSDVTAAAFLVNLDASTAWWRLLSKRLTVGLFFYRRVQFSPPPGVKASTNSKPQVLLMDPGFFRLVNATPLLRHGAVWSTERQVFASGEVG